MADSGDEYDDRMLAMLQLVWGEGFLSPGGAQAVRDILAEIDLRGRRVLDIGCGLGGLDEVIAAEADCHVTGIDVAVPLIRRAQRRIAAAGLQDRIEIRHVEPGPLPFADAVFDVVFGKDSWLHIEDKGAFFAELFRVLKPDGRLAAGDWMRSPGPVSEDMLYFFKMEQLTYFMIPLDDYAEHLRKAGFVDIRTLDISDRYRVEAHDEYRRLKGALFDAMTAQIGAESRDHFIEDWRSLTVVLDKGELRPARIWARKPAP
jgi:phosphoethanolamine N-methyltransferase